MAWFPFFMDLEGRTGLFVGGGRIALSKAERLAGYGPTLIVTAPEIRPELERIPGVRVRRRPFRESDLTEDLAFVVAATGLPDLDRAVSAACRERRIPVNVPDVPEACTFYFPALVRRGPLTIGISTGGTSPAAARRIKEEIEAALPDGIGEILAWMGQERERIRRTTEDEAVRGAVHRALLAEALRLGRPLSPEETEALTGAVGRQEARR